MATSDISTQRPIGSSIGTSCHSAAVMQIVTTAGQDQHDPQQLFWLSTADPHLNRLYTVHWRAAVMEVSNPWADRQLCGRRPTAGRKRHTHQGQIRNFYDFEYFPALDWSRWYYWAYQVNQKARFACFENILWFSSFKAEVLLCVVLQWFCAPPWILLISLVSLGEWNHMKPVSVISLSAVSPTPTKPRRCRKMGFTVCNSWYFPHCSLVLSLVSHSNLPVPVSSPCFTLTPLEFVVQSVCVGMWDRFVCVYLGVWSYNFESI